MAVHPNQEGRGFFTGSFAPADDGKSICGRFSADLRQICGEKDCRRHRGAIGFKRVDPARQMTRHRHPVTEPLCDVSTL